MQLCISKKLFIIVFLFTAFAYFFFSTPVDAYIPYLRGRVINSITRAPITGVWVELRTTENRNMLWCQVAAASRYERTDSNGYFSFDPIWPIEGWEDSACGDSRLGRMIDTNLDGTNDAQQIPRLPVTCYTQEPTPKRLCTYDFGCFMVPFAINVVKPVGWTGFFSGLDNVSFNNAQTQTTIQMGEITFVPSGNKISGKVFIDKNVNGTQDSGEPNFGVIGLTLSGASSGNTLTNEVGEYTFGNLALGTYNVRVNLPTGYASTTNATQTVTITGDRTLHFGISPTYTVTGTVFADNNENGIIDTGELNYTGTPGITASRGNVTNNANGTYTISNLLPGTITVSYISLPSGYKIINPKNGPPPSFQINVGSNCSTNGAKGAKCK